jgi:hypothetical protein
MQLHTRTLQEEGPSGLNPDLPFDEIELLSLMKDMVLRDLPIR